MNPLRWSAREKFSFCPSPKPQFGSMRETLRAIGCKYRTCLLVAVSVASMLNLVPSAQAQTSSGTPEWAWMSGNNTVPPGKGQPGVYGIEYQFAPSNAPGGRNWGALSWTDQSGRLWLFGGFGYDSVGTAGYLGDLWVFDPTQGTDGEWAWMGGSSALSTNSVGYTGQLGIYGTEYQFSASNAPGGREVAINWTDASGRFWLFGGEGFDSAGNAGYLNDLWVFDPSQGEWAWMGGSQTASSAQFACDPSSAPSGIEFQFADPNSPGHRAGSVTWTDQSGKLWLFGGAGCVSAGFAQDMDDLWVFDPSQGAHGEWAWMGGSSSYFVSGLYGAEYQFAASNIPGARDSAVSWIDSSGRLWLFGGVGYDSAGNRGELNDLWVFDPFQGAHGEWAWMGGSNLARAVGAYGTEYQLADSNVPGSRDEAVSWTDKNGKFWLFGGLGYDMSGHYGYLNDLWAFDVSAGSNGQWAWMGGSSTLPSGSGNRGTYGTEYLYATSNLPGGRNTGATWVTPGGQLWLFGGEGYDSAGNNGLLNDLWALQVPNLLVAPSISWPPPAPIAYGTALSSAQLDATANVPGTFTYSPTAGTVLGVGTQTLNVTFTPTDSANYTTASATALLTVNKATPIITWPTPAPITYGTALSSTQLDATASVPGTFAYTPAAGTVLSAGTNTLNVVFTPADAVDYTTATASVTLVVNPPPSFTLTASPSTLSVKQGAKASVTISVNAMNGFTGAVSLSVSGLPKGVTATISPDPATAKSTLTLTASPGASQGTTSISVTGQSGSLIRTAGITLTVAHK